MITANAQMVTLARESRGLTQAQLAASLGITQGRLSRIENGVLELSPDLLACLERELGYPREFYIESFPFRNLPISFFRKQKTLAQSKVKQVRATSNILRLTVSKLLQAVELERREVPQIDLEDSDLTPERVASDIRIRWHLPPGPIPNLVSVVEAAGVLIVKFSFGSAKIDGLSFYELTDGLPPIVCLNSASSADRQRFTLAHELAHVFLHHHLPLPSESCEDEANRFAAELLMPAADIKPYLRDLSLERLAQLKTRWRVSMAALIMRASRLETISPRQTERLYQQMSAAGYRKQEPVYISNEQPTLLADLVKFHLSDLLYSIEELGRATRLGREDLRELLRQNAISHEEASLKVIVGRQSA